MAKKHKFRHKLLLNQWMMTLFGIDPLSQDRTPPFHRLADPIRKHCQEGMGTDNIHHFFNTLIASDLFYSQVNPISPDQLRIYEENIACHTLFINEKRQRQIQWKYYQWLSLLFVEIYLDRYFTDREALLKDLNAYVDRFNKRWSGFDGMGYFNLDELNKLSFQNATGSGKTLLMHVNVLQYRHYAKQNKRSSDLSRLILITPNESLTQQHIAEFRQSRIPAADFGSEGHTLFTQAAGLNRVDIVEITKLADKDGPGTLATRSLGDNNLLLVDEGHRGLSGKKAKEEENAWFRNRAMLCEKGFAFEYSATFDQAVSGTGHEDDYARNILFDYSYRWFYEDGFGKDYQIMNLPKSYDQIRAEYLTACLLKYYQQLDIYQDHYPFMTPFNIEKPLWVFVGSTVSGGKLGKDEKIVATDVAQIILFIADFLADRDKVCQRIETLLTQSGQDTGLLDQNGIDIFDNSFKWLIQKKLDGQSPGELYQHILRTLFQSPGGGHLVLERVKGDSGEIILRTGTSETPFGLINVGDAKALTDHLDEVAGQQRLSLSMGESDFSEAGFETVRESLSSVNLLIGSKKFVEGWDCWRVSTLGLMHVGKGEGAQIIQLFGRGVRLKGYEWSLKRSGYSQAPSVPAYIEDLETLNVFGIEADFMDRFRQFLKEEGLPGNERHNRYDIDIRITHQFDKNLQIIGPKKKTDDGREYDFKKDAAVPMLGTVMPYLRQHPVVSDWYPRIQLIQAQGRLTSIQKISVTLEESHLALLDYDALYFELERYKRERNWHNFNIYKKDIQTLLADNTWYTLYLPASRLKPSDYKGVALLQQVTTELLKKYCDHYYNYCKRAFFEPRLELRKLTCAETENIPDETCYQLVVDSSDQGLVADLERTISEIRKNGQALIESKSLRACHFDRHLFAPLLHVRKGRKIEVQPFSLNESEYQFVMDLKDWSEKNADRLQADGIELFLLRNRSRGRGVGFFEAGSFYPDFILWMLAGKEQFIVFIDPHGLIHEGPGSQKILFPQRIREIQPRLKNAEHIVLDAFILSWTKYPRLPWGASQDELEANNILFMTDDRAHYIDKLFNKYRQA